MPSMNGLILSPIVELGRDWAWLGGNKSTGINALLSCFLSVLLSYRVWSIIKQTKLYRIFVGSWSCINRDHNSYACAPSLIVDGAGRSLQQSITIWSRGRNNATIQQGGQRIHGTVIGYWTYACMPFPFLLWRSDRVIVSTIAVSLRVSFSVRGAGGTWGIVLASMPIDTVQAKC